MTVDPRALLQKSVRQYLGRDPISKLEESRVKLALFQSTPGLLEACLRAEKGRSGGRVASAEPDEATNDAAAERQRVKLGLAIAHDVVAALTKGGAEIPRALEILLALRERLPGDIVSAFDEALSALNAGSAHNLGLGKGAVRELVAKAVRDYLGREPTGTLEEAQVKRQLYKSNPGLQQAALQEERAERRRADSD